MTSSRGGPAGPQSDTCLSRHINIYVVVQCSSRSLAPGDRPPLAENGRSRRAVAGFGQRAPRGSGAAGVTARAAQDVAGGDGRERAERWGGEIDPQVVQVRADEGGCE